MYSYPGALRKLIAQLEKLPGIGRRTATRLAFHILEEDSARIQELADSLLQVREEVHYCSQCHNITEEDPCEICRDEGRDRSVVCIVESPRDVVAMEKTEEYQGLYHVLHGLISPLDDIGPEELALDNFTRRVTEKEEVKEVIIATDPSAEGDATAMYITRQLQEKDIKVTRLAQGLPAGGDLEYADEVTLARALSGRREINE